MGRSVGSQQAIFRHIVRLALLPRDVVVRDQEVVEVLLHSDHRTQVIHHLIVDLMQGLEGTLLDVIIPEEGLDLFGEDAQRVVTLLDQLGVHLLHDLGGHVAVVGPEGGDGVLIPAEPAAGSVHEQPSE